MEGRQRRLLGAMGMLGLFSATMGCYIYVIVHWAHFWTLMLNCTFLMTGFFAMAACYGYDSIDTLQVPAHMTEERFRNMRDIGYGTALILYVLCYVVPAAAWYHSDGALPTMGAVIVTYVGNLTSGLAFIVFARLYIWPGGGPHL